MISDLAEIRLNFHLKREILILASEIASVPRHIENYIIPIEDLRGLDTSVQNQILQLQLELLRDIRRTVQPLESSPSSSRMHHDCDSALQMRPVHSNGEGPKQTKLRGKGTITDNSSEDGDGASDTEMQERPALIFPASLSRKFAIVMAPIFDCLLHGYLCLVIMHQECSSIEETPSILHPKP